MKGVSKSYQRQSTNRTGFIFGRHEAKVSSETEETDRERMKDVRERKRRGERERNASRLTFHLFPFSPFKLDHYSLPPPSSSFEPNFQRNFLPLLPFLRIQSTVSLFQKASPFSSKYGQSSPSFWRSANVSYPRRFYSLSLHSGSTRDLLLSLGAGSLFERDVGVL